MYPKCGRGLHSFLFYLPMYHDFKIFALEPYRWWYSKGEGLRCSTVQKLLTKINFTFISEISPYRDRYADNLIFFLHAVVLNLIRTNRFFFVTLITLILNLAKGQAREKGPEQGFRVPR